MISKTLRVELIYVTRPKFRLLIKQTGFDGRVIYKLVDVSKPHHPVREVQQR
jgi:hypothetical protein